MQTEGLDEGGFADARRARDAEAQGLAGGRKEVAKQGLGLFPVVGAFRFDQRDGAGQRPAAARQDLGGEAVFGGHGVGGCAGHALRIEQYPQ